ncbi:EpsG family protein [Candidatus Pelagibacter bacterium nBUS_29]|uniref:EpsG family protein n=1 Tax=Candidatus Pelagibacter bacterium nBUS_29 TaxID=3374190 RepID=UPI003EB95F20
MLLKNKINTHLALLSILIISLTYGFYVGEGFYGYSNDYYAEYYQSNLIYPSIREKLGSYLSTLTINKLHIGVHLTSFFLAFSSGILLRAFFKIKAQNSTIIFLFIYIVILHTHPIIMSTSGAMRQGWTMVFIFFSLSALLEDKKFLSIFFILISVFLHKSGLFYFMIYLVMLINLNIHKRFKNKKFLLVTMGISFFVFSCYGLFFLGWSSAKHRIVAGDFRYLWLVVNLIYIYFYFYNFHIKLPKPIKNVAIFLYFHACSSPAFLVMGLNWQYERINMVVGIPLILMISSYFTKKSSYLCLSLLLCMYLFLTIFQGMYVIGLT